MVSAIGRSAGSSPKRMPHRRNDGLLVPGQERPRVEPQLTFVDASLDRWISPPQPFRQGLRVHADSAEADGEGRNLVDRQRPTPAARHRGRHVCLESWYLSAQLLCQMTGPLFYLRGRSLQHPEGWQLV